MGNKSNGQPIWQYSAGGKGIWHYGIRVFKDKNGNYQLETGTLETGSTIELNEDYHIVQKLNGQIVNVWTNFFISETTETVVSETAENGTTTETTVTVTKHYMYDTSLEKPGEKPWTVTLFEHKPMTLIEAHYVEAVDGGSVRINLCEQWKRPTDGGETPSSYYYFYDGVFTFGLSSKDDNIRDTWTNDTASKIYLGPDTPEGWKINEDRGSKALVALVTPVRNNQQLNAAIAAGKQFYISVEPSSTHAYFMSLLTQNLVKEEEVVVNEGDYWNSNYVTYHYNRGYPTAIGNQSVPLENDLKNILLQYYTDGSYIDIPKTPTGTTQTDMKNPDGTKVELADLKNINFWNSYDVLNIGQTSSGLTWDQLKERYNILISNVAQKDNKGNDIANTTKYYYYRVDTGAYVGTDLGNTMSKYYAYDKYIYYTVSYTVPEGVVNDKENPNPNGGWSKGEDSGTLYEKIRDYKFEFFYQEVGKTPVSLGYTTVRVTGHNSSKGTFRMPTFTYGAVYYGQNNYDPNYGFADPDDYSGRNIYVEDGGNDRYNVSDIVSHMNADVTIAALTYQDATQKGNGTRNNPYSIELSTPKNTDDQGEWKFELTYKDKDGEAVTVVVPMVNLSANRFHSGARDAEKSASVTTAIISNGYASKEMSGTISYHYYDVTTGKYYESNGTEIKNHTANHSQTNVVCLKRYPAYTFTDSSDQSYLQFLHQYDRENYYYGLQGDLYSIWAGTDVQYNGNLTDEDDTNDGLYRKKGHTTEGVLVFEEGQNYCYIQFTYDNETPNGSGGVSPDTTMATHVVTKYLGYSYDTKTGQLSYSLSDTKQPVYVYIIEGIINTSSGVNTFVPADSSNSYELPSDEYVLWPMTTLTGTAAKQYVSDDPVYQVVSLATLNWRDSEGKLLGGTNQNGLNRKFQMADQGSFGKVQIENGNVNSVYNSNMMVVPVGSFGAKSVIPKGCVAFSVNATGTQTIRIIVSVPVTDLYLNQDGFRNEIDLNFDYYIGLWRMEPLEDGTIDFTKSNAVEKFEIPRSYSFSFENTPVGIEPKEVTVTPDPDDTTTTPDSESTTTIVGMPHYINVVYDADLDGEIEDDEHYRTYLNGDVVLVAYEFTIQGSDENAGTYIIGSVHGEDDVVGETEAPMEIVHFSVSGTASAGSDGVQESQIGAIDFVYDDNANKIVTIGQAGANTGISNGVDTDQDGVIDEFYSNYYSSHCLLYTDLKEKSSDTYIKLNQLKLSVRRSVEKNTNNDYYHTVITCTATSDDSNQVAVVKFNRYSERSDIVLLNDEELSSTTQ